MSAPWLLRPPQPMLPGWYTHVAACGCTQRVHTSGRLGQATFQPGCPQHRPPSFTSPPSLPPLAIRLAARRIHQADPERRLVMLTGDPLPIPGPPGQDLRLLDWYQLEKSTWLDLWAVAAQTLR